MNTKDVGDLNEVLCMSELMKRGLSISIPYGENNPYDFIADYNGSLFKIQCKTGRTVVEGESFLIPLQTTTKNSKISYAHGFRGLVDFIIAPYNNKFYLIPINDITTNTKFQLRFISPKNNQVKDINWAKDYELDVMMHYFKNKVSAQ